MRIGTELSRKCPTYISPLRFLCLDPWASGVCVKLVSMKPAVPSPLTKKTCKQSVGRLRDRICKKRRPYFCEHYNLFQKSWYITSKQPTSRSMSAFSNSFATLAVTPKRSICTTMSFEPAALVQPLGRKITWAFVEGWWRLQTSRFSIKLEHNMTGMHWWDGDDILICYTSEWQASDEELMERQCARVHVAILRL